MTISVDGNSVLTLRSWAAAYREAPAEYRFPSDPKAEFLPPDLDVAADEIERLRTQIAEALEFTADFDADDTDRTILRSYADTIAKMRGVLIRAYQQSTNKEK